ncbi:MAG: hypothetical protein ABI700_01900 [Chloroflexota bacterium]
MPPLASSEPTPSSFWQFLLSLLLANPIQLLTFVQTLVRYIHSLSEREGMYEVLEHDIRLELQDALGRTAVYSKRQKVRFLQNNVIAFQDQAYGDGDIFAEYRCSPGTPVDRYREGHRYRILISLRQSKQRGDVEEFHIERTIKNGFTKAREDLQTEIDHKTKAITMTLIFPKARLAKRVVLVEQKTAHTTALEHESFQMLPDGRQQVKWHMSYPKQYEAYLLMWDW